MDACPFRWQTKLYEPESGQYYFGYRYYDPHVGRWLSRDPLGEAGGFNLYSYCGNDPVNRHDPLGLAWRDWPLAEAGWAPQSFAGFDAASQSWNVNMRHFTTLTLGGKMDVTRDEVMSMARARQLVPYSSVWDRVPEPPRPGVGIGNGVNFADVASAIENHKGWNALMGVYRGALYAIPGGYAVGGVRALIGAQATGYIAAGLTGATLGEWWANGHHLDAGTLGELAGGATPGSAFVRAGEAQVGKAWATIGPRINPMNYNWSAVFANSRNGTLGTGTWPSLPKFKTINVGPSGHHVPAVRKTVGRLFEVGRGDKTRPTLFSTGNDPGHDHWLLHEAERPFVGPRQGGFDGTDDELFEAYRAAYENLGHIRLDVRSPNGTHVLGTDVSPLEAVDLIEVWLRQRGLLQ